MTKKGYLRLILKGIVLQTLHCVKYNLWCLDPPALTSGMIKKLTDMSNHSVEAFWRFVDEFLIPRTPVRLFKSRDVVFFLTVEHSKSHARYSRKFGLYLDEIDCFVSKDLDCIKVPSTHVMKIYVVGSYGKDIRVKLNAISILKMLCKSSPEYFKQLIELLNKALEGEKSSIKSLINLVVQIIIRYKEVLSEIMGPLVMNVSFNKLISYSPVLRKLLRIAT